MAMIGIMFIAFGYYYYKDIQDIDSVLNSVSGTLSVNKKSGFYNNGINIIINKSLDLPIGTKIYYTLNGDNPNYNSERYKNKIRLELDENGTKVYPLKASICYRGKCKNIINETYIVDKNIDARYNIDIISIVTDNTNLYDYNIGILVPGVTYDNNVANGATPNWDVPGNYNNRGSEWERESYVTIFNNSGKVLLEQDTCISVAGNTSVYNPIKSLKLRNSCNENYKKLKFNFYDSLVSSEESVVFEYNNIRLRAGSQDTKFGNIRSSLASRLSEESNFSGSSATNRAVVYINGNYYGIFDMQQTFTDGFIKRKYNLPDGNIAVIKRSERRTIENTGLGPYFKVDLNDPENRKKLESKVDMDEYLLYMAIEMLMNNTDFPQNNFGMWKYKGEEDKNNKYTDGRYRFLLYDVDLIYYSYPYAFYEGADEDTIIHVLDNVNRGSDSVFKYVLDSKYYRDKFVTIILDLFNTSFKTENVIKIVDEEYSKIQSETEKHFTEEEYSIVIDCMNRLKEKIASREGELSSIFNRYFYLNKKFDLNLEVTDGMEVTWNNMEIFANKKYSNSYYTNTDIELTVVPYIGWEFNYWVINDEKVYEPNVVINKDRIKNNTVNIKCVGKKNKLSFVISEISAKSDNDWMKFSNISDKDIELNDYYITDNIKNLHKYKLPKTVLKKNSDLYVNSYKNYYSVGDYISNFNLSEGETLYLVKGDTIIDTMYVPKMNKYESYGRYDNSSKLVYFNNYNNQRKK